MFISKEEKNKIYSKIGMLEARTEKDQHVLTNITEQLEYLRSRIINGELKDPEIHLFDIIRAIAEHIGVEFTTIQVPDPMRPPEAPATISKLVAFKKSKPKVKK